MINGGLRTKGITKNSTAEKPLISVVTVVYNGEKTLEQTILSVVNQTYNNVEYIIIDGGSKDNTLDIIKKYEDKIDYWQSEPDKGIYDAMNKGIKLATGEFIYILGCDDFLIDKDIFENIKIYLNINNDVVCGNVWSVNNKAFQYEFNNNYDNTIAEDLQKGISAPHQGIFIRRSIMNNYLFDTKYQIAADYKLNLQLWTDKNIKILKIKDKIAYYNIEGTSGKTMEQRKAETIDILKEFNLEHCIDNYLKHHKSPSRIKSNIVNSYCYNVIKLYLKKLQKHACQWEKCPYCKRG